MFDFVNYDKKKLFRCGIYRMNKEQYAFPHGLILLNLQPENS